MDAVAECHLGLLGLGCVGTGLVTILHEKAPARYVFHTLVADRSKTRPDLHKDARVVFEESLAAVVDHPEVRCVVEVVGGEDGLALDAARRTLSAGKALVTANKAMLAKHFAEIEALLKNHAGSSLGFEAAVCGGVPVIAALLTQQASTRDRVRFVGGVVNGSCNYLLTAMEAQLFAPPAGAAARTRPPSEAPKAPTTPGTAAEPPSAAPAGDLAAATVAGSAIGADKFGPDTMAALVREAQKLGYLEADPQTDLQGFDARSKLVLLGRILFDSLPAALSDVPTMGICDIVPADFRYARKREETVRLVAVGQREGDNVSLRVMPAFVPRHGALAAAEGAANCLTVYSKFLGYSAWTGSGAGSLPTGSSVAQDVGRFERGELAGLLNPVDPKVAIDHDRPFSAIVRYTSSDDATAFPWQGVESVTKVGQPEKFENYTFCEVRITDKALIEWKRGPSEVVFLNYKTMLC